MMSSRNTRGAERDARAPGHKSLFFAETLRKSWPTIGRAGRYKLLTAARPPSAATLGRPMGRPPVRTRLMRSQPRHAHLSAVNRLERQPLEDRRGMSAVGRRDRSSDHASSRSMTTPPAPLINTARLHAGG